jgi:hypothetical protein
MVGRRKGRKCVADHTKVSTPQVDFECLFQAREIMSEGAERANLDGANAQDGFGNQL